MYGSTDWAFFFVGFVMVKKYSKLDKDALAMFFGVTKYSTD